MDRRKFVKGAATVATGGLFSASGVFDGGETRAQSAEGSSASGRRPNILFIKVDELRFPSVFPTGIHTAAEFLQEFMPNLYELWRNGVKFAGHYTAGTACTPARGCLITGLYTQQSWLVQTVLAKPYSQISPQPWLNPAYPTYGKLLRRVGYRTPYIGKWHVSIPRAQTPRLEEYGFDGLTYYDPTGANLQGTYGDHDHGYLNDEDIAQQGIEWLQTHHQDEAPWCLTVSFINPHDKEFFWAGTEFQTYNDLFSKQTTYKPFTFYSTPDNPPDVSWDMNALKDPPSFGYPSVPPNWETTAQIAKNKPTTQTYTRQFSQAVWGGIADDPSQQGMTIDPYPIAPNGDPPMQYGVGKAPFSYWQRGLDAYTQVMGIVDQRIGELLRAFADLPASVVKNTVIVFTSDHGEYAGAHGYASGKVGSGYDEAFHVPLIVVDPSRRFTSDIDEPRQGLTSSVDILSLLASIGHGGSRDWLRNNLAQIYGSRHDLLPMLRSSQAPGRPYVLLATDESVPGYFNFKQSPGHIVGMRTAEFKLVTYANWVTFTAQIADDETLETEFYDYATTDGQLELNNNLDDPRIAPLKKALLEDIIPNELRAPLPGPLDAAQRLSRDAYLLYDTLIRNASASGFSKGEIRTLLGYGADF